MTATNQPSKLPQVDTLHECMYSKIYNGASEALDEILGPDEEDGAGEGLVAELWLVAEQRDEARAEVERLRDELATWRDDVSAQWRDECIRLQGEVERLTRKQLNADIAASSQPEAGAR